MSRYCEICDAVAPMHTMTCPNYIRTSDNNRIKELEARQAAAADKLYKIGASSEVSTRAGIEIQAIAAELREEKK